MFNETRANKQCLNLKLLPQTLSVTDLGVVQGARTAPTFRGIYRKKYFKKIFFVEESEEQNEYVGLFFFFFFLNLFI